MATVLIVETQLDRDFLLKKQSATISLKSIQAFGRHHGVTRTHARTHVRTNLVSLSPSKRTSLAHPVTGCNVKPCVSCLAPMRAIVFCQTTKLATQQATLMSSAAR